MKSFVAFVSLACAVLAAATPLASRAAPTDDTVLKEDVSEYLLQFNDQISVYSSGNCTDRTKSTCTSLDGVRQGTIVGAFDLQKACQTKIVITGGTEVGHADEQYSHANGYKLNFGYSDPLNECIKKFNSSTPVDGNNAYANDKGDLFVSIGSSWDATFKSWIKTTV